MQPGTTINQRYEILSEIGRGGMGVVYRGRSVGLDRVVAIKLFNDSISEVAMRRAQREAQMLANVAHENLVHVHSFETDEAGRLMMVFDFIEGRPLSSILEERMLTVDEVNSLFLQLCNGLHKLHESGMIHRDLKPSNLMITATESKPMHLVIIDFGLAKLIETSQKLTTTGTVLGTPVYMSPEQFAAESVSAQSDLYAAGCVLYEMLTGKPPFDNESPYMVAHAQIYESPPKIEPKLDRFFERALAKKREDRFASAAEMSEAFQKLEAQLTSAPLRLQVPQKRTNASPKVALVAATALVLAGVAGFATWKLTQDANDADTKPKASDVAAYRRRGELLLREGKTTESLNAYRRAMALATKLGRHDLRTELQKDLAGAYQSHFLFPQTLECLRAYARKAKHGGLELLDGSAEVHAGHALAALELNDEQIRCFEKKFTSSRMQEEQAHANRRALAYTYINLGRYRAASAIVEKNQQQDSERGDQARTLDLIPLTMAYALDGNYKHASELLEEATIRPRFMANKGLPEGISALIFAHSGNNAAAAASIDAALRNDYHSKSGERKNREALFQGVRFLRLSEAAARKIGDHDRASQAQKLVENLKDELRRQNAFPPR